jgi:AcrR family transcriptional regulator
VLFIKEKEEFSMPPRKRIFREDILKAAVQLVQEEGTAALSVRNIARTLNCSTQPIYSEFENMETLREELMAYIREHYLREDAGSYKQVALSFLHFAQREKNLFQLVYLRHRNEGETLFEDPNEMQTIHKLEVNLELPRQKAAEMHRRMQYYSYSMAVMMATGYLNFSEEEISTELTEYYRIMLSYYKQVKTEEELQHWLERSRNLLV